MADILTNLKVIKASRVKPRKGDIFAMQLPDESYLFGRVISVDAQWTLATGADPACLIYIFRDRTRRKEIPQPALMRPDRLLVSPIMTNRLPWTRGYFETLGNRTIEAGEALRQHCFLSASRGRYFDERGGELPGPIEPVGDYGLHSYRTIDDEISDALGIPKAPEDDC